MTTNEDARHIIRGLVDRFQNDSQKEKYTEQQIRESYVLPLFRALGWDTENPAEMTAEEQISRGFVDFGFYQHGVAMFYLETKRVSETLENPKFIRQAINYAYLRGVTWAVLCDFEQLLVYNAQWQGTDLDNVRFLRLNYADYADKNFDDLWLLSKSAFTTNEIDRVAEKYGKKAMREPVTQILFRQLTDWRKQLFAEFRAFGGIFATDSTRVDNAVQRLIDRLIFIRSMEDRGIEKNLLQSLIRTTEKEKKDPYTRLQALFTELDGVYNSNIFAASDLDHLKFSDVVLLEHIIDGLYGNQSSVEYDFNAISADVLGAVYEQYLSFKAQDPTAQTSAKSQKRKTQGIYYTPQFIVRYIVQNTLGEAIKAGADPLTMRVIDPACGSGSFLIEAFDFLDRQLKSLIPDAPKRREHILTHNLYGVDLDIQAVEVTRLNLLLRAATERRLLPPLTHIRHGDSLITPKFDYHNAFEEVFADGGFDVVIGNPPYVRQETLGAEFKAYVAQNYAVYAGTADLYVYFIERGLSLLKQGGRLGYILPNKWICSGYGGNLRQFLDGKTINRLVDFGTLKVFAEASIDVALLFLQNAPPNDEILAIQAEDYDMHGELADFVVGREYSVSRSYLRHDGWALVPNTGQAVLEKLLQSGTPLGEMVNGVIYYGVKTGLNEAFVINEAVRRQLIAKDPNSESIIKPFLRGRDIKRYHVPHAPKYVLYIPWGFEIEKYPSILAHLKQFEALLSERPEVKKGVHPWFALSRYASEYIGEFEKTKIIYQDISQYGNFALDTRNHYTNNTNYMITGLEMDEYYYLLGILNSTIFSKIFAHVSCRLGVALRWFSQYMEKMPIPTATDVQRTKLIALVQKQLAYHAELAGLETTASDRRFEVKDAIRKTDSAIDVLVSNLYGVDEHDVALLG